MSSSRIPENAPTNKLSRILDHRLLPHELVVEIFEPMTFFRGSADRDRAENLHVRR